MKNWTIETALQEIEDGEYVKEVTKPTMVQIGGVPTPGEIVGYVGLEDDPVWQWLKSQLLK